MSLDKMVDSVQLDANLTAIANKIRSAGGISNTLSFPNDFISAIDDIGREDLTVPKDVDFIDYDGRLIYSYTVEEFLALEELPANPVNKGLVAQGWNWTLADAKEFVGQYGSLVIGQSYITDDGKTRVYVTISQAFVDNQSKFYIKMNGITSGAISISWGDGAKSTSSGTGNKSISHVYQAAGNYLIEITVTSGTWSLSCNSTNANLFDTASANTLDGRASSQVRRVEIGSGITKFGRQPFSDCYFLNAVTIPNGVTGFLTTTASDRNAFGFYNMHGIVFPSGFNGKSTATITGLTNVRYISLPKSTTLININGSGNCLRKFTMYSLSGQTTSLIKLNYCKYLTHFVMPGDYTTVASNTVEGSFVKEIIVPATVTKIETEAFMYNYFASIHMLPTTVPTLSNTRGINGLGTNSVIYVPYSADHSILEAYKTATNWSTFADYMQEEPQS